MITEETIRSTKSEVEEFEESLLWADIKEELDDLANRAKVEYDLVGEPHIDDSGHMIVPNTSETLIHLGEIKGRRKAVAYFLNIPNILLQILEDKKNDTRSKQAD